MTLLALGLALFVGAHLLPSLPGVRPAVVGRIGEGAFKGLVSLLSLVGLALIVGGWGAAPTTAVHAPPSWTRHLAWTVVPLAFVMLASSSIPSRIGWFLGHPMSLSVVVWATIHVLANHELRSVVLFGTLGAWGLVGWLLAARRQGFRPKRYPTRPRDALVVGLGLTVAGAMLASHGWLFGMPAMP